MSLVTSVPVWLVTSQSLPLQIAAVSLLADLWLPWRPFLALLYLLLPLPPPPLHPLSWCTRCSRGSAHDAHEVDRFDAKHVVGVRRVPARVVSATFGTFSGFGVGGEGGSFRAFGLTLSTTWVQCSTFALFCVPDGAASMPDDEKATFRNNYLVRASTQTACPPM